MPGPLDGILVLDFTTLLPGPLATLMLAEAGAEVVKIERAGSGDDMRHWPPRWGTDNAGFAFLNRGKHSVALDLKRPEDRARLAPLIARADVLVEQFRPGVMDRLGLGPDALFVINPRLIYCSITGYGQTGPRRDEAGHDLNYIAAAGLLSLGHGSATAPVVPHAQLADIAGGSYPAVINILLALRERDRTGKGTRIDIAMAEGVLPFTWWALAEMQATGRVAGSNDSLLTGGSPRYQLYPTADGRLLAAAPIEPKFWDSFTSAIGLEPEWRDDSRDPAGTIRRITAIIAAEPADHWRPILAAADCCASIMATLAEAFADPHFAARGAFGTRIANADGAIMAALPLPIVPALRGAAAEPLTAPALGAGDACLSD